MVFKVKAVLLSCFHKIWYGLKLAHNAFKVQDMITYLWGLHSVSAHFLHPLFLNFTCTD